MQPDVDRGGAAGAASVHAAGGGFVTVEGLLVRGVLEEAREKGGWERTYSVGRQRPRSWRRCR